MLHGKGSHLNAWDVFKPSHTDYTKVQQAPEIYISTPVPKLVILEVDLPSVTEKEQIKINQCKEVDPEY